MKDMFVIFIVVWGFCGDLCWVVIVYLLNGLVIFIVGFRSFCLVFVVFNCFIFFVIFCFGVLYKFCFFDCVVFFNILILCFIIFVFCIVFLWQYSVLGINGLIIGIFFFKYKFINCFINCFFFLFKLVICCCKWILFCVFGNLFFNFFIRLFSNGILDFLVV